MQRNGIRKLLFGGCLIAALILIFHGSWRLPPNVEVIDDSRILVNLTNFDYVIGKPPVKIVMDKNGVQLPSFVLIVHSNPYQVNLRNSIRKTWSQSDPRALVYFALGAVNTTEKQRQIEEEEKTFHDIIQGNFFDSYRNLTYKHTMTLKWFNAHSNGVKFLAKIDDDVYAHIPGIYNYIHSLPKNTEHHLAAQTVHPHKMVREGKYRIEEAESCDEWTVTYAFGNQIIYSAKTVSSLYEKTKSTRFFPMDDMYILGYVRIQLNIGITNLGRYVVEKDWHKLVHNDSYEPPPDWCFSGSYISGKDMRSIWKKMEKFTYRSP